MMMVDRDDDDAGYGDGATPLVLSVHPHYEHMIRIDLYTLHVSNCSIESGQNYNVSCMSCASEKLLRSVKAAPNVLCVTQKYTKVLQ